MNDDVIYASRKEKSRWSLCKRVKFPGAGHPQTTMATTLHLSSSSTDTTTRRTLSNLSLGVAKSKKIVVVTGQVFHVLAGFRTSAHQMASITL
ncbi:DHS-like NAD FAD-binding domain-containing [Pyrrhoderma noxium]|uniref:DHS-like NAD FAD-binding domain-containing n=1 Tax=Pyrrhoderma noxium TaxID=2282107 RepID=A0A286USK9_9AGAM|nr:DHS-like NAD FAD-binding domain-containing [Pyrrhoderma noxium]